MREARDESRKSRQSRPSRGRMFPVVLPEGPHPFPYRTRKLSPPRPMILLPRGSGKVGHCRVTKRARWSKDQRAFSFLIGIPVCQGSAAPHTFRSDPFGLGGRKPSGIPSAAINRSQCFSQFQVSSLTKPRQVPVPPARSLGSMPAL